MAITGATINILNILKGEISLKRIYLLFGTILLLVLAACGGDEGELEEIVFADAGWDSIRVHNHIAQTIIEEGFGYKTDVIAGSTAATVQGLRDGDINAYTEVWTDNIKEAYEEAIEAGDIIKLATNFDDNDQ